jgi:two-component system osmolarity sensor histidine kinase EnvZ
MARFKRFVPRSLFGRALLIIVTPLVLLQLVAAYIFYERHWDTVGRHMALDLANDIVVLVKLLQAFPEPGDQAFIIWAGNNYLGLNVRSEMGGVLPDVSGQGFSLLRPSLERTLSAQLRMPFTVDTESRPKDLLISVELDDRVLHVITSRKRVFSTTTYLFILWMVGTSIVLLAIAIFFLRNQVRSVRRLAEAAERLGKGQQVPDFKPEGALEVRQAAAAFIVMRDRIQRQIAQRTELLAGVSHDLRTPLTRMKLQLAMADDDEAVRDLQSDVAEMERMIDGYLAFARGEKGEEPAPVNIGDVLDEAVADARRKGAAVTLGPVEPAVLALRRNAFRRCLANLLDNAMRHGERIVVGATRGGEAIEITIDDDGPGVPEDQRQAVFKAFYRLDASRNLESGGVGLGLTIAGDVVHGLGGDIILGDSPIGGLRATVRLPL